MGGGAAMIKMGGSPGFIKPGTSAFMHLCAAPNFRNFMVKAMASTAEAVAFKPVSN
jgi:hypothetical protein